MMLRWAACISSGSAWANAFSAASRSPLLIASSTVRTAPRIWVRRDLLMMVRRAILRVAFLAEVVLAILEYPWTYPGAVTGRGAQVGLVGAGRFNRVIDAGVGFGCSRENAIPGANRLAMRRHPKNSGGGI